MNHRHNEEIMAESVESVIVKVEEDGGALQQAVKVNGRYVDPWGTARIPSKVDVLRWRLFEKNERGIGGTWRELFQFKHEELEQKLPVLTPDSSVLSSPPSDDIQVTWLGHASVLIQMDGLNILTDPVLSGFCGPNQFLSFKRYRPAPCSVDELPNVDVVCISHNHYDHLDLKTVKDLIRRFGESLHWLVPMGLKSWMINTGCENVTELEWWEEMEFPKHKSNDNAATKFVFTPTQHWSRRSLMDENKVLWGSWTVIGPKHRFFFAGDTGYCKGFKQIGKQFGPFDFAAIPIGAYKPRLEKYIMADIREWPGRPVLEYSRNIIFYDGWFLHFQHVDPTEAVCIHEDIQSRHSLGIHWGTFPTGYEHFMDPPKDLSEALKSKEIPDTAFFTMKHGETRVIK